jgi:hypothetical protein
MRNSLGECRLDMRAAQSRCPDHTNFLFSSTGLVWITSLHHESDLARAAEQVQGQGIVVGYRRLPYTGSSHVINLRNLIYIFQRKHT